MKFDNFDRYLKNGFNFIPILKKTRFLLSNLRSIASYYEDNYPILLESTKSQAGDISILGINPFKTFSAKESSYSWDNEQFKGAPITALENYINSLKGPQNNSPFSFLGGALGFLSYEACHYFEKIPKNLDDLKLPDIWFQFFDQVFLLDHSSNELWISVCGNNKELLFERQNSMLSSLDEIFLGTKIKKKYTKSNEFNKKNIPLKIKSNFSKENYLKAIEKIKLLIKDGETYQANLSQRLETKSTKTPFEVYNTLSEENPSTYAAFINTNEFAIISASPERLIRKKGNILSTNPIGGTRRTGTKEEINKFIEELKTDEKEIAEHSMLVDLERNDIGRISKYGSIKITQLQQIVEHKDVLHIESEITGIPIENLSLYQIFEAMFPGGTITGVPKIKTMEILSYLEPNSRGIYTGSIGYINYDKNLDFNIAIRSILFKNKKYYIQIGSGITYDSNPEMEYQETFNKSKSSLKALENF